MRNIYADLISKELELLPYLWYNEISYKWAFSANRTKCVSSPSGVCRPMQLLCEISPVGMNSVHANLFRPLFRKLKSAISLFLLVLFEIADFNFDCSVCGYYTAFIWIAERIPPFCITWASLRAHPRNCPHFALFYFKHFLGDDNIDRSDRRYSRRIWYKQTLTKSKIPQYDKERLSAYLRGFRTGLG